MDSNAFIFLFLFFPQSSLLSFLHQLKSLECSGVIGFILCSKEGPPVDFRNPINPIEKVEGALKHQRELRFYNSQVSPYHPPRFIHFSLFSCLHAIVYSLTQDQNEYSRIPYRSCSLRKMCRSNSSVRHWVVIFITCK